VKLRAYIATYILFLAVLFLCFTIISAYMSNAQLDMYKQKCLREFQTISRTLVADISVLALRGHNLPENLAAEIDILFNVHARNLERSGILINLHEAWDASPVYAVSFVRNSPEYFIRISAPLAAPFEHYTLTYYFDFAQHMSDIRRVQNVLLFICVLFSAVTAVVLYFILAKIFEPLGVVSKASRNIANGRYTERINIIGTGEIKAVADDFNQMANEIEKHIQELKEETERKQRFADNLAHEMRTPLTAILGYAEYIQKAVCDEEKTIRLTGRIAERARYMNDIAELLMQLATLREYTPEKSEINIQHLFEDVTQTLSDSREKNMFRCNSNNVVLNGHEGLIKSLLLNLCMNSIRACDSENGQIRLSAQADANSVTISVSDNGCGIPPESLEKVTEAFYRVDKARSAKDGGAGLGLALCKQIADLHNAELQIESAIGKGTTVSVTF